MKTSTADFCFLLAALAFALACVIPPLGMVLQFVLIAVLVAKCDVKTLPALMVLVLGKGNLPSETGAWAMRLGVTLTPGAWLSFIAFFLVFWNLVRGRYDRKSTWFGWFWMAALIPALVMSLSAKMYRLSGIWSYPVMDFLVPSLYFWALSMAKTYEEGKDYLVSRFAVLLCAENLLVLLHVLKIFSFINMSLMFCIGICLFKMHRPKAIVTKLCGWIGCLFAGVLLIFGRAMLLAAEDKEVGASDEYGSTFTTMAMVALALYLAMTIGRRSSRLFLRKLPILMTCVNICFVAFVLTTQSGKNGVDVEWKASFDTFSERLKHKLWGDRATVWQMGWEEMKVPPYVFRDLRQFWAPVNQGNFKGMGLKLLPHNQFITLLSRDGWWLGGVLSIFIVMIWARAMKATTFCLHDRILAIVLIPTGLSIFFVVGVTGQSVVAGDLWGNAMATIVFPGIAYGQWLEKVRLMRMGWRPPFGRLPPNPARGGFHAYRRA